jgi:hypothetical protein
MMNDSKYAPNASVFAVAVSVISRGAFTQENAERIVRVVEAQLVQLKVSAPTVDYVRLLCELTLARLTIGISDPFSLLVDDAVELQSIPDHGARAASFAWMVWLCAHVKHMKRSDDTWGIREHATSQLNSAVSLVLSTTAEQEDAFKAIVRPLAAYHLEYLEKLIEDVNTSWRRDALYKEVVEELFNADIDGDGMLTRIGHIRRILSKVISRTNRSTIAEELIRWAAAKHKDSPIAIVEFEALNDVVTKISDPDDRSIALARLYKALSGDNRTGEVGKRLLNAVEQAWHATGNLNHQIGAAFILAADLYGTNESAGKFLLRPGGTAERELGWSGGERRNSDSTGRLARSTSSGRF